MPSRLTESLWSGYHIQLSFKISPGFDAKAALVAAVGPSVLLFFEMQCTEWQPAAPVCGEGVGECAHAISSIC